MDRKKFIKSAAALALFSGGVSGKATSSKDSVIHYEDGSVNWKKVRKQFNLNPIVSYMNNGTMGVCPEFINKTIYDEFKKVSRAGVYPGDLLSLRQALARVTGSDYKQLTITKNVTEGINLACWGIELKEGDEVLMTRHEHAGSAIPWLYRAKTEKIVIKTFELASTAAQTLQNFKNAITDKTKVIAVPHIPCTTGQVLPVKDMCKYAADRKIISIVDGAHPLGMIRFNIEDIGCDYYAGCLHKWMLAPLGLGFFYVKAERLNATRIHNLGAYSSDEYSMAAEPFFVKELTMEAQRFSPGTYCGPLHHAAVKSIEWYEKIGAENIENRVKELAKYLQGELLKLGSEIELFTPEEDVSRAALTTFRLKTHNNKKSYEKLRLDPYNIVVRHVHEGGLDALRVSTHYYNNEEEINKLVKAIHTIIGQ